jgi:D-glycero-D-manno-heptose 1,7-bisphosphate phosphatase
MKVFSIKSNEFKPAIFLDRDGVINKDIRGKYITDKKQIKIYKTAIEGLKKIEQKKYHLIIITNQSAIQRGFITDKESREINLKIREILNSKGIILSAIYYCPHKPEDKCPCRKPKLGLLEEAKKDFKIDMSNSYMIGDKESDMKFAKAAKLKSIFVLTGQGKDQLKRKEIRYNYKIRDLRSLKKIL